MKLTKTGVSIDELVRTAIAPIATSASQSIARAIAEMVATRLESELQKGVASRVRSKAVARARRPRAAAELTRWVADRRARRVPTFVIKITGGLDTKKKIVAKFGENAVFEKEKGLPERKPSVAAVIPVEKHSARVVKAKPPIVRKAAGTK